MSTQVEIDEKLYNDIKVYCSLNALKIKAFVNELLKKAFIIEKYGETPFSSPQLHNDEQNIAEEKQESKKNDLPIEKQEVEHSIEITPVTRKKRQLN